MWTCFLHWGVYPLELQNESEKLHIEPSQNATVTKCDTSGILAVAFCDFSHFVIMAVMAQTESNDTENVLWVLRRVPMFTFDMNMKSCIFAHFGVISLLYLFVCMYISHKAHNRCAKKTFLIVSDVDVNMFPALRSIPIGTTKMNPCCHILWFVTFCVVLGRVPMLTFDRNLRGWVLTIFVLFAICIVFYSPNIRYHN